MGWRGLTSSPASSLGGAARVTTSQCNPTLLPARNKWEEEMGGGGHTSTSLAPLPMTVLGPAFTYLLREPFCLHYVFWSNVSDATW